MPPLRAALGLLVGAVLCASGCSVQLAYNNLDRLARWSASDLIDMDQRQRAYFDAAFDEIWYWHRTDQLPRYASYLESLAPRLTDGTSEAEMQALVDQVTAWYEALEARSLPMAVQLMSSLSDRQVADLAEALARSNRELEEPEADRSLEQARAFWVDEFTDRFDGFSGRLNALQRDYVARQAQRYQPERVLWADYRRRWQADLLALLQFRRDLDGLQAGFRQLTRNRDLYHGPGARVFEHNEALTRETSVWLLNSLSERQQRRFAERVQELAADFRELAAQAPRFDPGAGPPPCLVGC